MSTETRRLVRMDSPGRPPWLSHSSWTMFPSVCVFGSNCVFWFLTVHWAPVSWSTLDCRLSLLLLCSFTEKLPAGDQRLLHGPGTESPLCQSTSPQVQGLWVFRTVQRFSGRSVNEMQLLISEAWKLTLFMNLYDLKNNLPCFFLYSLRKHYVLCQRAICTRENPFGIKIKANNTSLAAA